MRSSLSQHTLLRRIILGIAMGLYIMVATILLGKRSGAHMNPSVTLSFLFLGKMKPVTALGYIIAQVVGASCGALLLSWIMGELFSHPLINYAMTEPRPPYGFGTAFIAEAVISFITMFVVLFATSSKKFEKYGPALAGVCIAVFIAVDVPLSGMSMNPARSFAASLVAGKWNHIWIYCTAPILFMLIAAELFIRWKEKRSLLARDKVKSTEAWSTDYQPAPHYPVISI